MSVASSRPTRAGETTRTLPRPDSLCPVSSRAPASGHAPWLALWLAGLGLVGLVLILPALYLVDLPAWVYQGALFRAEIADAHATPWSLQTHPVPNTLATLLPALLLVLVGPIWAGKILATGLLIGGFAAAWALARAASRDDTSPTWARTAILIACAVVSSSFWNGYVGYQLGVVGAMALGAMWLRRGRLSAPVVLVGTVALFLAHAIPFAVVALTIGADALRRRDRRQLAALLPAAALTAWYVLARAARPAGGFEEAQGAGGVLGWVAYKVYTVLKVGPFQHPVGVDGSGMLATVPGLYWLAVGLSGLFMGGLVIALAHGTWRMPPGPRRIGGWIAWALAGVALVLPPFALNVVNPGERVLVLALVALVTLVPLNPRLLRALGLAALLFFLDDARALWTQRAGLSDAERVTFYADRVAREQAPDTHSFQETVQDAAVSSTPLLGHPVLLHSDLYDAVRRRDWTRQAFDSGLLRPPDVPVASP